MARGASGGARAEERKLRRGFCLISLFYILQYIYFEFFTGFWDAAAGNNQESEGGGEGWAVGQGLRAAGEGGRAWASVARRGQVYINVRVCRGKRGWVSIFLINTIHDTF